MTRWQRKDRKTAILGNYALVYMRWIYENHIAECFSILAFESLHPSLGFNNPQHRILAVVPEILNSEEQTL